MRAGIGLIGRDDELDALDEFLGGSSRCALVVRGDAGVGKTALADEIAHRAVEQGWRVMRATGVEAETTFALGGLNQVVFALREELAGLDPHDQDVLAPVLGADPVAAPAPMTLAMSLLALVASAARAAPLLLVLEDLQWFDDVSVTVLNAAGRRLSDPRVRFLATARPQPGRRVADGWEELDVRPLSEDDGARLVDQAGVAMSPATRQMILDAAAGNPLALQELPRNAEQIDTWTAAMPLSDRLVDVFGARLRRLDEHVRTELLRAALDGTPAATTGDTTARYAMLDVEPAIEQGLLVSDPSGDVVFRHPLVRAAVIHQASASQRREAHARLAGLYGDVLMRRATHLSAAATGPDQAVADVLDRAAHLSIRRGGAAIAVDWLRRAAELSTEVSRREQMRADAAFVASQSSRFEDAEQLAEDPDDEPTAAASILTAAYLALYRDGDVLASHRQILSVLHHAEEFDDALVARMVKLLLAVTMYCGEPERWRQTDQVVDRLAARLDVDARICQDAWGDVTRRGHTVLERLATQRAQLARREPWDVMRLGVAAYYVDGLADFRTPLRQAFERESDRGAITNAMTMLHLLLLDQIASGDWTRAHQSIRLGLDLSATHRNELFHQQFVAYDGLHAAMTGDAATVRRCTTDVEAWARPRHLGLLLTIARRATTLNGLGGGDFAAAYASATREHVAGEPPPYSKQMTEELLDLVEAAVLSGHVERARAYVDQAISSRVGDISPRLTALVDAARAMTATGEDAAALYERALTHPGLAGYPFEQNRIRLSYGMWLRRQRRTAEARSLLTLAVEQFGLLSARPWEERAASELRASGANVTRKQGNTVLLTSQERKIAELAAAGQSNKQIAAQLYLSPRTIGAHLYRIFPKLGVTSRAALGQALNDLAE